MARLIEIDCPECDGTGDRETLVGLSYDGDQTWNIDDCRECNGSGRVLVEIEDSDDQPETIHPDA